MGVVEVGYEDVVAALPHTVAWRTGFWFWTTQTGAGSMAAHNAIINGAGFGQTIPMVSGGPDVTRSISMGPPTRGVIKMT